MRLVPQRTQIIVVGRRWCTIGRRQIRTRRIIRAIRVRRPSVPIVCRCAVRRVGGIRFAGREWNDIQPGEARHRIVASAELHLAVRLVHIAFV